MLGNITGVTVLAWPASTVLDVVGGCGDRAGVLAWSSVVTLVWIAGMWMVMLSVVRVMVGLRLRGDGGRQVDSLAASPPTHRQGLPCQLVASGAVPVPRGFEVPVGH